MPFAAKRGNTAARYVSAPPASRRLPEQASTFMVRALEEVRQTTFSRRRQWDAGRPSVPTNESDPAKANGWDAEATATNGRRRLPRAPSNPRGERNARFQVRASIA